MRNNLATGAVVGIAVAGFAYLLTGRHRAS